MSLSGKQVWHKAWDHLLVMQKLQFRDGRIASHLSCAKEREEKNTNLVVIQREGYKTGMWTFSLAFVGYILSLILFFFFFCFFSFMQTGPAEHLMMGNLGGRITPDTYIPNTKSNTN